MTVNKPLFVSFIFFFAFLLTQRVNALTVDSQGRVLVEKKEGQVLSKEGESKEEKEEEKSKEKSGPSKSLLTPAPDQKTETPTVKTEVKNGEVRTETKLPTGIRVKTQEEQGKIRTDIYEGGTKLRLEKEEGKTVVKLEGEDGQTTELPSNQEELFKLKIEERGEKSQIKVSAEGEKFILSQDRFSAITRFPLSVNLKTNELTVSTPAGEKTVTVLPNQAIQNMLAANVIDQVKSTIFTQNVTNNATPSATAPTETISLTTTTEGTLVYEIPGISIQRLFGLIPVNINKTAIVSAETGELTSVRQSILSRIIDLFSF